MQQQLIATPAGWRHAAWLAVLIATSVAFSLGFACAVPFAAFGAATALTLNTRDALLLTVAMWLANQLVGFTLLAYPWDAGTFTWGAVLGVVAVLSTVAARSASARLMGAPWSLNVLAAFAAAFIAYEGGLYLVSAAWLGGTEDFTAGIVADIAGLSALAFLGLLVLERLGRMLGFAAALSLPIAVPHHA